MHRRWSHGVAVAVQEGEQEAGEERGAVRLRVHERTRAEDCEELRALLRRRRRQRRRRVQPVDENPQAVASFEGTLTSTAPAFAALAATDPASAASASASAMPASAADTTSSVDTRSPAAASAMCCVDVSPSTDRGPFGGAAGSARSSGTVLAAASVAPVLQ